MVDRMDRLWAEMGLYFGDDPYLRYIRDSSAAENGRYFGNNPVFEKMQDRAAARRGKYMGSDEELSRISEDVNENERFEEFRLKMLDGSIIKSITDSLDSKSCLELALSKGFDFGLDNKD